MAIDQGTTTVTRTQKEFTGRVQVDFLPQPNGAYGMKIEIFRQKGFYLPDGTLDEIVPGFSAPITIETPDPSSDAELQSLHDLLTTFTDNAAVNAGMEPTLEAVKKWQILEVQKEAKSALITNGFDSDALGVMTHYNSTYSDRVNLIGAKLLANDGMNVLYICVQNGVTTAIEHTPAQMTQVFYAAAQVQLASLERVLQLTQAIEAAETVEAVRAITWSMPIETP